MNRQYLGISERCYDEAKKHGRILFCGFVRRFDPTFHSVVQKVKAGEVGQIQVIKFTDRDSPYPDISVLANLGNLFYDCGIHTVDLMLHTVGEMPESVCAFGHAFHDDMAAAGDIDTAGILLKFPSGIVGQIDMSRDCPFGYDQRMEVFGSKGMLEGQNPRPTSLVQSNASGITSDKLHFSFPQRLEDAFAAEMRLFIKVVTTNVVDAGVATKQDTLRVVRTLDAIHKSWKTGQQVKVQCVWIQRIHHFSDVLSYCGQQNKLGLVSNRACVNSYNSMYFYTVANRIGLGSSHE